MIIRRLNNNINDQNYESLLSCSTSFSDEFHHSPLHKSHKTEKEVISNSRDGKKKKKGVRVKESFAVVKKSSDLYARISGIRWWRW